MGVSQRFRLAASKKNLDEASEISGLNRKGPQFSSFLKLQEVLGDVEQSPDVSLLIGTKYLETDEWNTLLS